MFPVKIGNEVDVKAYSESLIKGEQQLLVTVEGNFFITNGDGTFSEFNGNNAKDGILALHKLISDLENNKSDISHKHNDIYYIKDEINNIINEVDKADAEINDKILKINKDIVDVNLEISKLDSKIDYNVFEIHERLDRDFESIVKTIEGVKLELNQVEELAESIDSKLKDSIEVTKIAIDRIDRNLLTLSDDISNLSKQVNKKIEDLSNNVYTKEEIDAMNIPASRITVDVTQDGTTTNMTMQEAISILFSRECNPTPPPKPTEAKCGKFKAGQVKCGSKTETAQKSTCGTFKAGKVKCGQ